MKDGLLSNLKALAITVVSLLALVGAYVLLYVVVWGQMPGWEN